MGPLQGVKVVELGMWVAGPGAGGIMADWGADVVKVEAPEGDPMRRLFSVLSGYEGAVPSPPFDLDNRGKKSVVLDIRDPTDRTTLLGLIADADVFLSNLRLDALSRLGLDPAPLLEANPRLVYARVTGYGTEGPDVDRPGYDVGAFWARSGVAASLYPADMAPPYIRSGFGDHTTAMTITAGISAALFDRERTGQGQLVDTSLLRMGVYCMGWDLGIQLRMGQTLPTKPRTESANPTSNCYRAADDRWFWLIGIEGARHWPGLVMAIDRPDLAEDERFATAKGRYKNAGALIPLLDELFETQPRDHWTALFDEHEVWWAPVNTLADVPDDPQVVASGAIVDVPAGAGSDAHRAVNTPVDFGGVVTRPAGGVPGLGEHSA